MSLSITPRYLLITADDSVRRPLEKLLAPSGVEVHVTADVNEAHRLMVDYFYRVILLDLSPSLNAGLTPLLARETTHNPGTPFVVLLGSDEAERSWVEHLKGRCLEKLHTMPSEIVRVLHEVSGVTVPPDAAQPA